MPRSLIVGPTNCIICKRPSHWLTPCFSPEWPFPYLSRGEGPPRVVRRRPPRPVRCPAPIRACVRPVPAVIRCSCGLDECQSCFGRLEYDDQISILGFLFVNHGAPCAPNAAYVQNIVAFDQWVTPMCREQRIIIHGALCAAIERGLWWCPPLDLRPPPCTCTNGHGKNTLPSALRPILAPSGCGPERLPESKTVRCL